MISLSFPLRRIFRFAMHGDDAASLPYYIVLALPNQNDPSDSWVSKVPCNPEGSWILVFSPSTQ
jgi:hypothetical protein